MGVISLQLVADGNYFSYFTFQKIESISYLMQTSLIFCRVISFIIALLYQYESFTFGQKRNDYLKGTITIEINHLITYIILYVIR